MDKKIKLGATGKFPEGKLNKDDEGGLRFAIASDQEKQIVVIDWGKPVSWLAMTKKEALALGNAIITIADELK